MALRLEFQPLRSLGIALCLCGCSGSEGDAFSPFSTGAEEATSTAGDEPSSTDSGSPEASSSDAGSTDASSTEAGESSTGIKLDVLPDEDLPADGNAEAGEEGCQKVDFLFVIDNSNSMSDEQQLLIASFPGFIAAIEDALPSAADFHIGVTKTDVFGFDDSPVPDPANPCAYQLGGLLSHATPPDAKTGTGLDCEFESGANYMIEGPLLADEFACVAAVGTKGNTGERQAEATLAALDDQSACSAGFLRKDALTVVVVITDEDDDWSAPDSDAQTNAQAWYEGVLAAEDGIDGNLVFVLISGGGPKWPDCGPLDLMTMTGADDSPKLSAWAQKFGNHELSSVCSPGYADSLAAAIGVIETACSQFEPIP